MTLKLTVMIAALLGTGLAGAAEVNRLGELRVFPIEKGAQVVLKGSQSPNFTVFRLPDPDRLIVDVSSADAHAIEGQRAGAGPISGLVTSQFSDARSSIGRILIGLSRPSKYDVHADGERLIISVFEEDKETTPTQAMVTPTRQAVRSGADGAGSVDPEKPLNSEVEEREVKHPARQVNRISYSRDTLRIHADGEFAKDEVLELSDPPRLVLDLYGVGLKAKVPKVHSRIVKEIRAGAHVDKVRLVFDLRGPMPAHTTRQAGHRFELVLKRAPAAAPQIAVHEKSRALGLEDGEVEIDGAKVDLQTLETGTIRVKPEGGRTAKGLAEVKELTFRESATGGRIDLKLSAPASWKVEHPDDRSAVLTLESARLAKKLERSLDTSALETPVKMISAFTVPQRPERVRVVVSASSPFEGAITTTADGLSWQLNAKSLKAEANAEEAVGEQRAAAEEATSQAPAQTPSPARSGRSRYVGKRVSFEFKDIDIHNLLRLIAEVSKKNIVVADDVQGKVSIRLRNVPWDQALELILRSKGLGKEELGNIVRVAPLKALEEEAKLREERRKSMIRQEELVVQLIPVNFAAANDMSARVKDVLSDRGTVTVDARTNVLIVRDILSNIGRARSLVQKLDTQTPQVLIESRIVEANTSFSKQIGVQWGGGAQAATGTGNPTGLVFPYNVAARGGVAGTAPGLPDVPNFAVNLPAAVGSGSGGAIGMVFGSAGGAATLNLRLSALENQGSVKTISAPKVTTLDHSTARISQGVSIPFSQTSAAGVNTTFVEARLSLEVTPHVTQNGSVLMNIRAENNQPDPANTGANGQPAIQRKEANTQVLVKDGDTTVIGGIYVRRGSSSTAMVPFLGKLPLLGFFFRNTTEADNRQELLIFITPRIVNRQTIAQNL
jgi:type IV pilus assembly protein PilQ